jgi:hypothetical protein
MDNFNVSNFNLNNQPKKFSLPKIIFIILGLVVLAEIIYASWTLLSNKAGTSPLPFGQTLTQNAAKISLTTSQQAFQTGEIVPVKVTIDSGTKSITGVDLVLKYDPAILEITKENLVLGKIMDEYPLSSVDSKQGLISISGISSLDSGFSGSGEFATLNFKAKSAGKTSLVINFEKGTTIASNVVDANTSLNILEEVVNLEILIQ